MCHADTQLADIAPLLRGVGALPEELRSTLRLGLQPGRINVYILRDRAAYQAYLRRYFPAVPYRRAIFIQAGGQRMLFVQRGPDLSVDLRHEATHALLQSVGTLPLWLDEGLAVYFEDADRQAAFARRAAGVAELRKRGEFRTLAELEKLNDLAQMRLAEYSSAWAWTHFLLDGPPAAQHALRTYLAELAKRPSGPTLGQTVPRLFPHADQALGAHFAACSPTSDEPGISARLDAETRPK